MHITTAVFAGPYMGLSGTELAIVIICLLIFIFGPVIRFVIKNRKNKRG